MIKLGRAVMSSPKLRKSARRNALIAQRQRRSRLGARRSVPYKTVLDLDGNGAKSFFFEHDSYCSFDLPPYFQFSDMLKRVETILQTVVLGKQDFASFKNLESANYSIYANKGDRYSWRKLQLINPVLYVKLVEEITEANNWIDLQKRFQDFGSNKSIKCKSVPVVRSARQTRLGTQINSWLGAFEGESIRLALSFEYMFKTDISNCYASMYTHSVAWALLTKPVAKINRRDDSLLGNKIDIYLQSMSNGQTNGIPEGSSLMDFIAEMVLGYADELLGEMLDRENIPREDYRILRYRDDYRIFVREEQLGERILKLLSQNLMDFGMRLNQNKTGKANHIILDSIKPAKLASYARHRHEIRTGLQLRNELLFILGASQHSSDSGNIRTRLTQLATRLEKKPKIYGVHEREILSILLNIAYENPSVFPVVTKFVSTILNYFPTRKQEVFEDILRKMRLLPNSSLVEIWLQRIAKPHGITLSLNEPMCETLDPTSSVEIFDSTWQPNSNLAAVALDLIFVDKIKLKNLSWKVALEEITIFPNY